MVQIINQLMGEAKQSISRGDFAGAKKALIELNKAIDEAKATGNW